jgi:cation diffusion facilitator family transporter
MANADSRKVVLAALAGNVAIAACKFAAAILSHSSATLAEAVHSLADAGNQGLLLVGMTLAARPANDKFPFGRASERYFWPFVVAMVLFSGGGAFAIFDGIQNLRRPEVEMHPRGCVAIGEFRKLASGRSVRQALLETRDPTVPLVLAEDATAMAGLVLALVAVGLSGFTGQDIWDPIGSIVIGVLLCSVALVLAKVTHGLIIGESATREDRARVLELASAVEGVDRVTQLLTMHLGPDDVLLAMKVAFRPTLRVEQVEEATNAIEARIRSMLPHMRKIFVEADSQGDRRGVQGS